jgi:hypothetical protein
MTPHNLRRSVAGAALAVALAFLAADRRAADAQQAEKTVEQTHKNIQVLTGMPDSQLRPVMNLMNAALGVNCAFCHVRKGEQMDFASDENHHKQVARQMIKMTREINKNNFGGQTEVGCATCHQGKAHPASVPQFPPAAPAARATNAAPGAPAAGAPAPKPEEVVAKYVAAVGGREAAAKLKTRALKGTYQTARGMTFDWAVSYQSPDKLSSALTSQQGQSLTVLSGATGWVKDQRGQREMGAAERAAARDLIELLDVIKLPESLPQMSYGGRAKVGDRDAHTLRFTRDGRRVQLFFDVETGLLLRRLTLTDTPVGAVPEQTDFEDYREVDGVKLPMTIRSQSTDPSQAGARRLTEVKHNVALDPAQFSAPASKP